LSMIQPRWRVFSVSAFVLNCIFVRIPGRLDGDPTQVLGRSTLFAPAGWAFAIWGVIYLGELIGIVWICVVKCSDCQEAIARSVPGWCAATLAQCFWCVAFRPWALDQLWVSAIMLGSIAACLYPSQQAMLRGFKAKGAASVITRMVVVWPRSLHLGWTTAASVVNVNSFIGQEAFGEEIALCVLVLSITLAAFLGVGYTASGLPSATLAVAWALQAVSTGKPKGPAAEKLGGAALQGLSYSESVIALLLTTMAFSSVLVNSVTALVRRKKPELEQELGSSAALDASALSGH